MGVFKKIFCFIFIVFIIVYIFLFTAVPYFLNKKDYSKILTDSLKKETGLILVIHNYKLAVSPSLALNLKAEDVQLFYPDKKQILNVRNADVNISTLNLLKKEIKINKLKAKELQLSTKLLKNGKTTLQQYLEEKVLKDTEQSDFTFSPQLPEIYVDTYIVKIKDEASGQKFKVKGAPFKVKQNINFLYADFITKGKFYCYDRAYASYDLKISVPKVLFENIDQKNVKITVSDLYKYNFYTDITANVKINEKNKTFDSIDGKINVDNFSLKIGSKQLPKSYFHFDLNNGKAVLVSKFYTNKNEVSDISAKLKLKKPYDIDINCVCPKAELANLQQIAVSLLDILKVKNNLSEFTANGILSADFNVKTNLKSLTSNGSLKISNANISHKKVPLKFNNINAFVDFSNDSVNIKKSNILVNNQPLKITGKINAKAEADLIVKAENLDLNHIMNAFPFLKLQKNLVITSGKLSLNTKIKGKLEKIKPEIYVRITNLSGKDTINKINLVIKEILVDLKADKENYSGAFNLKNFLLRANNAPIQANSVKSDLISAKFDNNKIVIVPSKITTGSANITLNGEVTDYLKQPKAKIEAKGMLDALLLKQFIPAELSKTVQAKGHLPVRIAITAKDNKAAADVQVLANSTNYISPVTVENFGKTNTLTAISAAIQGDTLSVNDLSIYYAPKLYSLNNKADTSGLKKAVTVKGGIEQINTKEPVLKNLQIKIPEKLKINLPDLNNAKVEIKSDLTLNGKVSAPLISGSLLLSDLSVPQFFVKAKSAEIGFSKNVITTKLSDIKIKNIDMSLEASASSDFFKTNKINYVKVNSTYLDLEEMMALIPLLPQVSYVPGVDFPFEIAKGKLDIKTVKLGEIKAHNVVSDLSSKKNILYLKNLFADTYGGKTAGHITYNFPYSTVKADLQGRNLDAGSAAKAVMPKEQAITGRLNFDTSVTLLGSTLEQQMKTMSGNANILIQHGHLGQLGRFEHFLYAQNLLSQKLIYASLNSAKQAISPKDTGNITYLKGVINFNRGYARLRPVLTAGPNMSMYVTGGINLISNDVDLEILGKVSSEVSSSMGLLGKLTIKDFLDEHTKYGQSVANLFNFCNSELPEMDISKIPDLSPNYKYETKNFRVIISGDPNSVKAVKSFTWVNPAGTKKKMTLSKKTEEQPKQSTEQASQNQSQPQTPVIQSVPKINLPNQPEQPDFLNSIPDHFQE